MAGKAERLRIYVRESDRFEGEPLAGQIVRRARAAGLAGATVVRGFEGFGTDQRLHAATLVETEVDLPLIIEIIDVAERIAAFLPELERVVAQGLLTLEDVRVVVGGRFADAGASSD